MLDVITIGDGMISMDPISKGPLRFSQMFERKIGGAELQLCHWLFSPRLTGRMD